MRKYYIKRSGTNEIVKVFETDLVGKNLIDFEEGLFQKVDFKRFYISRDPGNEAQKGD